MKDQKILAIICARGGSTRVPGKNIKELAGKPLIAYTIQAAKKCGLFDKIIISTDDSKIAKVAKDFGAEIPFMRSADLAQGSVSRWDVLKDAVKKMKDLYGYIPDIVVDLSPTAPLRESEDIKECIAKFISNKNSEAITTVCPADRNPYFNMLERINGKVKIVKKPKTRITQSQKAPQVYSMNDAINVIKPSALFSRKHLLECKNFDFIIMPRERSVDIDEQIDFDLAEILIKNKNNGKQ